MIQSPSAVFAEWRSPDCPFAIRYSTEAIEIIRQAVVDGFFVLPRGGVEVGGLLLGTFENRQLTISDAVPLECEHAFGPSFTLSANDQAKLAGLLVSVQHKTGERYVVGWYHSHTRSEIFLSEADLDIHQRLFPEAWQVALVMRPSMFEPVRAGFFFRGSAGRISAQASDQEFRLDAAAAKRNGAGRPSEHGGNAGYSITPPAAPAMAEPATSAVIAPAVVVSDPPPALAAPPVPDPPLAEPHPQKPVEIPRFLQSPTASSSRWWLWVAATCVATAALGVWAIQTRDQWLAPIAEMWKGMSGSGSSGEPARPSLPPDFSISALDNQGQMMIRWDANSPAATQAVRGTLTIVDNGAATEIPLDQQHLRAGSLVYIRGGKRVDVRLSLEHAHGAPVEAMTSFLGALPQPQTADGERLFAANGELRRQRDALTNENGRLTALLASETARAKALEQQIERLRKPAAKSASSLAGDPLE
jgi:proteasome lid subunit RPN8/RPN11